MNNTNLNSFLKLGYFLDYENEKISINTSNIDKIKYKNIEEEELITIGAKTWKEAIANNFIKNRSHLVPVSGGLDSRAILAGLLEHTEAKNIYTYTFGSPNTLDYDIGNHIAKALGTKHTRFDLTQHKFDQDELEAISKRVDFQTMLFHHAPVWKVDEIFNGCQTWNGFMGDPIAGSKLVQNPSNTLEEAKKEFIKKNVFVRSIDLATNEKFEKLIECKCISSENLTLDEQLDFTNRQTKYIAPHVLMDGYNYQTPFLNQSWVNFMLGVDNKYRINQNLYKKILLHTFPVEFSYKTKTNFGLPLGASKFRFFIKRVQEKMLKNPGLSINTNINYLDFNEKIRTKNDLREIVVTNILDLKKRNLIDWINIENILNTHLSEKANFADALIVLASLEIHLKSGLKL